MHASTDNDPDFQRDYARCYEAIIHALEPLVPLDGTALLNVLLKVLCATALELEITPAALAEGVEDGMNQLLASLDEEEPT